MGMLVYSRRKAAIVIIGGALLVILVLFMFGKKTDAYAVFDSNAATYSYDSIRRADYADNVVRITFTEPFMGYGPETIEDYTGAKYFRDPSDENSGYLVLPTRYSMESLVSINDDLLNEYGFLSYAGIILKK